MTHFWPVSDFVVSPILNDNLPSSGIRPRISVNSFCCLADATRAASAAASLASRDKSVVVADNEDDAVDSPTLFLALIVTEYIVRPLKPVIVKGEVVVPADVYEPPFSEYSKSVIAAPLVAPAVNEIVTLRSPDVTEFIVGAEGAVAYKASPEASSLKLKIS